MCIAGGLQVNDPVLLNGVISHIKINLSGQYLFGQNFFVQNSLDFCFLSSLKTI